MSTKIERLSYTWALFGFFILCLNLAWAIIQAYHYVNNDRRLHPILGSIISVIYLAIIMGAIVGYSIGFIFFTGEFSFYSTHKSQRNYRSYGSIPDNTTEDLLANSV